MEVKQATKVIQCQTCGEEFEPQRSTAKFCSDQCRYRWNTAGSKRKRIPDSVRFAVLERDRFRCRYCGTGSDEAELKVDHLQAVDKGGALTALQNLVTACNRCNSGKGNKELTVPVPSTTGEPVIGVYWDLRQFPSDEWFAVRQFRLVSAQDGLYHVEAEV